MPTFITFNYLFMYLNKNTCIYAHIYLFIIYLRIYFCFCFCRFHSPYIKLNIMKMRNVAFILNLFFSLNIFIFYLISVNVHCILLTKSTLNKIQYKHRCFGKNSVLNKYFGGCVTICCLKSTVVARSMNAINLVTLNCIL